MKRLAASFAALFSLVACNNPWASWQGAGAGADGAPSDACPHALHLHDGGLGFGGAGRGAP